MDDNSTKSPFYELWRDLDRIRDGKEWTREALARRIEQVSSRPCNLKTLHDRMKFGRKTSWDDVRYVVLALELDHDSWKEKWEKADDTARAPRRRRHDSGSPVPAGHSNLTQLSPAAATTPPFPPKEPTGGDIVATVVIADHAGVFRNPGDANPLTIKIKGERITLPRQVPDFIGPDDQCYRMVRTPTRTSSGYAYMLANSLAPLD